MEFLIMVVIFFLQTGNLLLRQIPKTNFTDQLEFF